MLSTHSYQGNVDEKDLEISPHFSGNAESNAEQTPRRMWGAGPTTMVGGDADMCGH